VTPRGRAALTVSGTIPDGLAEAVAAGRRPRADYVVIADQLGADLIDHREAVPRGGSVGRLIRRVIGENAALAWACFRSQRQYDVIVTDGEQVGLPYAVLTWFSRKQHRPRHSMIVHIMSVRKKVMLFKALRLGRRIDSMLVYATAQREFAVRELGMPPEHVHLMSFMVDTEFFSPDAVVPRPRRMICTAGLEFRDYDTLVEAVRDLDVEVVIAAASPWSKRRNEVGEQPLPGNVTVCKLSQFELRQLYADAMFVVMPLRESDFQAGVTAILEAMAMSKAVVCTRTTGQTDVIVDGETGLYVPPSDAVGMRKAIAELLGDPNEAARLGAAGRQWVCVHADVATYASRLAQFVDCP
jgi:glycosyltransferase involved in cell wall biosynthesis